MLLRVSLTVTLIFSTLLTFTQAAVRFQPGQLAASHSSSPQLLSVRLLPEAATLWGVRSVQRFLVLGKYTDGLERDVTSGSRFSMADPEVAKVDQEGRVVALADGVTVLGVEVEDQVVKSEIRVEGSEEERPFSFGRDIGGIFTKHGCNTSDCHGGVKGKGGLKLSKNALYPQDDYRWIVEGGVFQVLSAESGGEKVPRINREEPEKSLLLQKATFNVPHGGGQRFTEDSSEYKTILKWVGSGAPYGEESGEASVRIERLEVMPQQVVLDREGKHGLLVRAHLSNGQKEDMTDQVLYVSNNPEVVKVTPTGLMEAVRTGETAVMIRAAGHAVSATVGVIAEPIPDYPQVERRNLIDEYVFAKLRKFNIIPSELSSDEEFLRRVCLDLTGMLPPPDRVREFLSDRDPEKRGKLIEILLDSPEYVEYWTFRFSDFLRVSSGASSNARMYERWVRESIAENKPYDQLARERVAAQGWDGPSRHFHDMGGNALPLAHTMMAEQARVFLGRRLDCAQCHNHPFETWSQNQFWGLSAFFAHVSKINPAKSDQFYPVVMEDPAGHGTFGAGFKTVHPRTKEEVQPVFLDGTPLPEERRGDMRLALAEWLTSADNLYFAEAIVNRMWGYFFVRGIVNPVDDFRSTNPATHSNLLKALARDFVEHGHDLKHLMRLIVHSRTYQLSSTPNETNREDRINYSRSIARPLDAEVLQDAISQVTEVRLDHFKSRRAIIWTRAGGSHFLKIYGQPDRHTVPERKVEPTLPQALHQLAGTTYTEKLSPEGGCIERLLENGTSDSQIIEEFYLASLSRFPSEEEQSKLQALIGQQPSRREAIEDLLWGLFNSEEFIYNH